MLTEIGDKFEQITVDESERLLDGARNATSPFAYPASQQTRMYNRYMNVQPYMSNRIKLRVSAEGNDYINASPIKLKSLTTGQESKFIVMQGPKQNSVNRTWRMIWDECEDVGVIVMLTETHEAGAEKCYRYFPADTNSNALQLYSSEDFGDGFRAIVKCVEKSVTGFNQSIEVRKLIMQVPGQPQEKTIWHLLYTKWPDFGVPVGEDVKGFFEIMKLSRTLSKDSHSPRIVHCSAGVGRSGTFISLDYLMAELEEGGFEGQRLEKQGPDPIFDLVTKLRLQRCLMVQAEPQYLFLYAQTKRLWTKKYHEIQSETKSFKTDDSGNKVFD